MGDDDLQPGIFDFLFHEAGQNRRLDRLADAAMGSRITAGMDSRRLEQLKHDVGLSILLQLVTLRTLMDKGLLTGPELHKRLMELDSMDGVIDGEASPEAMRRALALWISGSKEGGTP